MPEAMRDLVVNADDLGMTAGINRAIIEAHRAGIVTSASLLANGAAFDDAIDQLRRCPDLGVGLHVNLTHGRPLADAAVPSLTSRSGRFRALGALAIRLSVGAVSRRDLEAEIDAQAQRIISAGITPTHFDSHENVHLHPAAASALATVARRRNVRWVRFRNQRPVLPWMLREAGMLRPRDHARHALARLGSRWAADGGNTQPLRWIVGAPQLPDVSPRHLFGALVRSIEDGVTEWVCHPGYADAQLRSLLTAVHADLLDAELKVLTGPDCRTLLDTAGIRLLSYVNPVRA